MTNHHREEHSILTALLTICILGLYALQHCTHIFSFYYTTAIVMRHEHQNNAPATTAVGLCHIGALNN